MRTIFKILIFLVIQFFAIQTMQSSSTSDSYDSFLKDWKFWIIRHVTTNTYGVEASYKKVTVIGDTVIAGVTAKRLECVYYDSKEVSYYALIEKDNVIYLYYPDIIKTWGLPTLYDYFYPILDFNVSNNTVNDGRIQVKSFSIFVNNKDREIIESDRYGYWISEVGAYELKHINQFGTGWLPSPRGYDYIEACYEEGECVFNETEFRYRVLNEYDQIISYNEPNCVSDLIVKQFDNPNSLLNVGNTWEYYINSHFGNGQAIINTKFSVTEDSIIDSNFAKKIRFVFNAILNTGMEYSDEYDLARYEEKGILYAFVKSKNKFVPLVDFNVKEGDWVERSWKGSPANPFYVDKVQTLNICGFDRKVITVTTHPKGFIWGYWIEGIGATNNRSHLSFEDPDFSNMANLIKCYNGNTLYFSLEEFEKALSSSVNPVPKEVKDDVIYDLNGLPVEKTRKGNIYIIKGKVVVWK